MISILILSWERAELLAQTLSKNLECCGYNHEVLITDQGSKDPRVAATIHQQKPEYVRANTRNEGVAASFNQLYLRARGDFICLMSNDIFLPHAWGATAIQWLNKVPNPGIAAINWGHDGLPPLSNKFGITAHWLTPKLNRCFGPMIFRREVVNQVGLLHEGYGPYGIEDSDFNERVNLAGFNSFYVPELFCHHAGTGAHDSGEYRANKNNVMEANTAIFNHRLTRFHIDGIREPLPPMREPI